MRPYLTVFGQMTTRGQWLPLTKPVYTTKQPLG